MNKEHIDSIFQSFRNKFILIIGDAMIDAYIWGHVERKSPEANVPVVSLLKNEEWLGGAANVALNILSLQANPVLCSVIGNDTEGDVFMQRMQESGLITDGIIRHHKRKTTVKTRVISDGKHVLRIDKEITEDIDQACERALMNSIMALSERFDIHAMLFQDYNKGVLSCRLIGKLIEFANKQQIPVIADPKKKNFKSYQNIQIFKPNLKELAEGIGGLPDDPASQQFIDAAEQFRRSQHISKLMVTLSEKGLLICCDDFNEIIPAHSRNIRDVSGAGDTVASVASLCMASGIDVRLSARLANLAGGLVCESVGVVPISCDELKKAAIKELPSYKVSL